MSEHEFNVYLSLLSRLLRLKPGQREEIADELRDHLEERLEELLRVGYAREEAVRRALDDFGDAAGLAAEFTRIATSRRRRTLMRLTLGTLAVTAAAVFVGMALWPDVPGQPVAPRLVAQQPGGRPGAESFEEMLGGGEMLGEGMYPGMMPGRAPASPQEVTQAKLRKPLENVSFDETPFQEVLDFLSQSAGVDILVDRRLQEQADLNAPVTLQIEHTRLPAGTVLELALEQAGFGDIAGYTIRDGLVYITGKSQSNQIRVYNVRDLVSGGAPRSERPGMRGGGYPGMGMYPGMGGMEGEGMEGGYGGEMMPGGMPGIMGRSPSGTSLTEVIRSTIHPRMWMTDAGLAEYNGLLIVKAGPDVHREIEQLLQMMRSAMRGAAGGEEAASVIIPTRP